MEITPRIEMAKALDNFLVYIKFVDGKEKVYDMTYLINTIKFYERLKNKEYFKKVAPRGTTIEWPNGEDVCPENLYYDSIDYITQK